MLRLQGDQKAVIEAIRFVGTDGLDLVGAKLAPPDRKWAWVQADEHWPPRSGFEGVELVDAIGASITPMDKSAGPRGRAGWELLLAVKVLRKSDEPLVRDGIEVDYRVGDQTYRASWTAQLVVCTAPHQLGDNGKCPLPED